MRKITVLFLATLLCALSLAPAQAQPPSYDRYDRYERGRPDSPPPRMAEAPPPRHAAHGETYFFGHLGIFDPNSDTDGLAGYDSGMNFDLGIGSRVSPILAVDGTFGAYAAEVGSKEAGVVPLTIGARLIVPNAFIEPYIGGGLGLYFTSLKEPATAGFSGIDDTSTDFGGYLSIGADFWLNPRVALNFEGKYHFVNPSFEDAAGNSWDVNMGGWTVNLGVRASF
jgi:hypothetical protein